MHAQEDHDVTGMGTPPRAPNSQGSCLTLGNELSEETHVLTKQEILLGKDARVESNRVREPKPVQICTLVSKMLI